MKLKNSILPTALMLVLVTGAGCRQQEEEAADEVSSESTEVNPPVGVVNDSAGFFVRAQQFPPVYSPVTHAGSNLASTGSFAWSSECKVAAEDAGTTASDIICYVEADELDLFYNGVTLQHNVPSEMCTYFSVSAPYYFKFPTGSGPTNVRFTTDAAGNVTANNNAIGADPYCAYDFSKLDEPAKGPNCCLGKYTLTSVTPDSTTSSVADWGGKVGDCLGGPALDIMGRDKFGFPKEDLIYVAGSGVNATYTLEAPWLRDFRENYYAANYFTSSAAASGGYNDSAGYPAAFLPANNDAEMPGMGVGVFSSYIGTAIETATQPFWEYTCWNRNREANARIRVLVRSWDRASQIGTALTYGVTAGQEGAPFTDLPIHDYNIWLDVVPALYSSGLEGYPLNNE